mmetsp:Transcript_4323/g.10979  ORF Transcript_4323/g.10979 Transcript_4323/m.10979 type:complete len:94 (+) Transcript_4323:123-404(+)
MIGTIICGSGEPSWVDIMCQSTVGSGVDCIATVSGEGKPAGVDMILTVGVGQGVGYFVAILTGLLVGRGVIGCRVGATESRSVFISKISLMIK